MPTRRTNRTNGHHLEEAVAVLINNQAHFMSAVARIESELAEIRNILIHHQRILDGLPEAIREKIGFKAKGQA
ncbi:MAG: hypothetical protein A3H27_16665 [Acidobacteria bacterium RIFCSPLOWO2_02_FULL_59_13]|nr:MAG: hypothetical protein A3H27_16665 [Acidobacteria bacterium RIFCSPLOWO2_02_FULL_59_13]